MGHNLNIEVVDVVTDKERGGKDFEVRIYDEKNRASFSRLLPGMVIETEWYKKETGKYEMVVLPMGCLHARRVAEKLREIGYPSAGKILRCDK